ncbi:transcription factor CP2-like protein 1 [Misgurnus anguillicaudatus]|uniref:transcription factor CP2-like protein 1 n=1 Tax=Misgurnus anguillicaudatus TaxID=75329 RepID=UPI003CCFBB0F
MLVLDYSLNNTAGSGLLKMSRDDFIQICGPADGISLFNTIEGRGAVSLNKHCSPVTMIQILCFIIILFDLFALMSVRCLQPCLTLSYRIDINHMPKEGLLEVRDSTVFMIPVTCRNHSDVFLILRLFIFLFVVYHALYLEDLPVFELAEKIANLYDVSSQQIHHLYRQGPTGIYVLVSDAVRGQKMVL